MSGVNIRKVTDSLLKGTIKAMGPIGLPAQMLLDTIDAVLAAQKEEKEEARAPSISEIADVVKKAVREQAARDAWSKIYPVCMTYSPLLERGTSFRPSDFEKLESLVNSELGPSSSLRQGLTNIYDAQMAPSDMATIEHAFPAYAMGANIEISLMLIELSRNAKLNGSIDASDWSGIRQRVDEHKTAIQRAGSYIDNFVIEKILREELTAGKFTIGDPAIGKRKEELQNILLGGPWAKVDLFIGMDQLSGLLAAQIKPDVLIESNRLLSGQTAPS